MGASTILVLDDGHHSLETLTSALEDAGYAPVAVAEGDDPLGQFEALTPELVFLSLKARSALEVCEAIRLTGHGAIVPIIFVGNGHAKVRSPSEALSYGGDYHFGEPLELGKILAKVQTYVGAPPAPREEITRVDIAPVVDLARLAGGGATVELRSESASDLASASDDLLAQIEAESRAESERRAREEAKRRAEDEAERFLAEEAQRQADEELARLTAEADERRAESQRQDEARKVAAEEMRMRAEVAAAERRRSEEESRQRALEEAERWAEEARREAEEETRRRAQAEERALREAEERARREAEEQARREAEEQARREAEEQARREAEEQARREAEEQARREAEEQARREAEEQARREAEEQARREAEEQARREAEEQARREAEEQARREAEEQARREAEEQARREAEERARREAEDQARREAEERALREAEEQARREAEEQARREAEEQARREAAALKARLDLEARIRREAEEQVRREAEERARREAEEQARREAEEQARREAEEQARREAEEQARREAEEQARREAEEQARREAEERVRREEERRRAEQEEAQRRAEEERLRIEAESRRKAEEEQRRRAEEARRRAEEESRRLEAEAEALRLAEEEIRQRRLDDERRKAEEEARRRAEEERQRVEAEAEAKRLAEAESQRLAEAARRRLEEALERAEAERRVAEQAAEEQRRRSEEAARRKFAPAKPSASESKPGADTTRVERSTEIVRGESGLTIAATLTPLSGSKSAELQPPSAIEDMSDQEFRRPVPRASVNIPTPTAQSLVQNQPGTPMRARPQLRAFTPEEGVFSNSADMADLLAEAFRQQITGRIDFTSGTRQKSVVFERGHPVDAYSSQVYDRMEEYLLREGRVTKAQYHEVRVKGLRGPRRIGAFLVNEGYLRPDELFTAVRGQLEELIFSLFEWDEGSYAYVAEHVDDDDRVTLERDPRAIVTEGIRRKYLLPRAVQKLGSPSSLLTRTDPEGRIDSDALGLTPDERQIARLVDGTRNIDDIVFSSGLGALRVYHVLAALCATGYAEVAVRGIEGINLSGATDLDGIDRQRILERVEQVRQADYFQILGVSRGATTYEVEAAFERITRELAPPRLSPAVRASLKNEIDEIERVLEDARDVLRDQRMREAYARNLPRL